MNLHAHQADDHGWGDPEASGMSREERLLTACAWCQRVRLDADRWVDAESAIRELRTFEWPEAPLFTHGLCEQCFEFLDKLQAPVRHEDLRPEAA